MRRKWRKAKPKEKKEIFKSNRQIKSPRVFLIDETGEKIGEMETRQAMEMAEEARLDLVEVNPKADPPVVKIMNLGQMKYEQEKKAQKQKSQQKKVEIKAIRLSVRISKHDFDFRLRQAVKFLEKGNKLKLELILKGRERQHPEKARETIQQFINEIKNNSELEPTEEQPLTKQGGRFIMILANKK